MVVMPCWSFPTMDTITKCSCQHCQQSLVTNSTNRATSRVNKVTLSRGRASGGARACLWCAARRRRWTGDGAGESGRLLSGWLLTRFRISRFAPPTTAATPLSWSHFRSFPCFLFFHPSPARRRPSHPPHHPPHPLAMGCTQSSIVDEEAKARKSLVIPLSQTCQTNPSLQAMTKSRTSSSATDSSQRTRSRCCCWVLESRARYVGIKVSARTTQTHQFDPRRPHHSRRFSNK